MLKLPGVRPPVCQVIVEPEGVHSSREPMTGTGCSLPFERSGSRSPASRPIGLRSRRQLRLQIGPVAGQIGIEEPDLSQQEVEFLQRGGKGPARRIGFLTA